MKGSRGSIPMTKSIADASSRSTDRPVISRSSCGPSHIPTPAPDPVADHPTSPPRHRGALFGCDLQGTHCGGLSPAHQRQAVATGDSHAPIRPGPVGTAVGESRSHASIQGKGGGREVGKSPPRTPWADQAARSKLTSISCIRCIHAGPCPRQSGESCPEQSGKRVPSRCSCPFRAAPAAS